MEKARIFDSRNFLFVLILTAGCSSRPCREPRAPELDQTKSAVQVSSPPTLNSINGGPALVLPQPVPVPATGGASANAASPASAAPVAPRTAAPVTRIRVYKPDGSRQCEQRAGKSIDSMERELSGIVVHAREKRKDGLMHIQVCGSPSGMINLYEIDSNFLKQAEERGFKRLED